jgi:NADH:ubiquinone oxidoreductase subunit K
MNEIQSPGNKSLPIMHCEVFGEKLAKIPRQTSPGVIVNHIVGIIVNIVLICLNIVLNSITILTVSRSKKLRGTPCFFLIMLLSCADLIVGLFGMPMSTYVFLTEISSAPGGCVVATMEIKILFVLGGTSIMMYLLLTYER